MCVERDCGHCIPGTDIPAARAGGAPAWGALQAAGMLLAIGIAGYVVSRVIHVLELAVLIGCSVALVAFTGLAVWVLRTHRRSGAMEWGDNAIADEIRAQVDPAYAAELAARQVRVTARQIRPAIAQRHVIPGLVVARQDEHATR